MIQKSDKKSCIYQRRNFIVDEKANVYGCLNLEHNEENYCGNLFIDEIESIYKRIGDLPICEECIQCGVAPTDMSFKFFYDSWFQMIKKIKYLENVCALENPHWDVEKDIMKIIMLLRSAEQRDEKSDYFASVRIIMKNRDLGREEIEKYINDWAMRPAILLQEFGKFMNWQR